MNDTDFLIRTGAPITAASLPWFPILMRDYELFLNAKPIFTLRLSTLPPSYAALDFLNAVFQMDTDFAAAGKPSVLFQTLLSLYALALRLPREQFFSGVRFKKTENGFSFEGISVGDVFLFSFFLSTKIRSLIAEQNGILLPDEADNAEIMEAYSQKLKTNQNQNRLHFSTDDLIASVAFQSRVRESEILSDWTVREFEARRSAIDRDKNHKIYAQAELSGFVKFKNGNPAPSWCFDLRDERFGTVSTSEITSKLDGNSNLS